jgi:uncharacterized protein YfaP (DUF2135 family)
MHVARDRRVTLSAGYHAMAQHDAEVQLEKALGGGNQACHRRPEASARVVDYPRRPRHNGVQLAARRKAAGNFRATAKVRHAEFW